MDYTPETPQTDMETISANETQRLAQPIAKPRLASYRGLSRDLVEILLLAVVIYTFVNLTTARAIIEGPSMQPNFYTGQWMVINRAAYYFKSPERGDVVVLHSPRKNCIGIYETEG